MTDSNKTPDFRMRVEPGEYYRDVLKIDAFMRGVSDLEQANTLLGAKVEEREVKVIRRLAYMAWKRGTTPAKLWLDIITGQGKRITPEEIQELRQQGLIDEVGDIPGITGI